MPSFADNTGPGIFIPQSYNFDVTGLEGKDLGSLEFREFMIRISQALNIISIAINQKDSGNYALDEFVNSQALFPDPNLSSNTSQYPESRQIFRKVINFCDGTIVMSLPNNATTSVPHGIDINGTTFFTFTRIYATASIINQSFIPIPYVDVNTPSNNITLNVDNTNVNITTAADYTNYTFCYVILEYIKQ